MGIVFILVRKKWGVPVEILKQTMKMCQMRGGLIDLKCSENKNKMHFIPLIKVNNINFDYDHNILQQF